jgi:hypothetical protein
MNRRDFHKTLGAAIASLSANDLWAAPTPTRTPTAPAFLRDRLQRYNPVWTTPSNSSLGSMPLSGSQGTALNVWVQDGAVCFYIARNDAYNEDGNLDKLGCVRLRLEPNPLASAQAFEQRLDIYTSRITVYAKNGVDETCDILLWLDLRQPVVFIETRTSIPTRLALSFLTWRDQPRTYPIDNWNFPNHKNVDPKLRRATADTIEPAPDTLLWYHRNDSAGLVANRLVDLQRFTTAADTIVDPSRNLIYGGLIRGTNLVLVNDEPVSFQQWEGRSWNYRSTTAHTQHLTSIALACEQSPSLDSWKQRLRALSRRYTTAAAAERSKNLSAAEWHRFWAKSYIFINPDAGSEDIGWQVSKNYQLFRYMLACNRGGRLPLKFNGGIFNIDTRNPEPYRVISGAPSDAAPPDSRRWGNLFMAQNQRLVGWPGLLSGDDDLITPSLNFYADRVKTAVARSQVYWKHSGAAFMEPLSLYGLPVQSLSTDHGPCSSKHLALHFSIQIEFAWMALEWSRYSGADIRPYLPLIESVVRFYDEHYRAETLARTGHEYGPGNKLVLFPMNCLELYPNATAPIEVVCGLHRVVAGVLAVPASSVPPQMRAYFRDLQPRLPEIPTDTLDGKPILKAAASFDPATASNITEFPEGYAVWPYRLYGIGSNRGSVEPNNTWDTMPAKRKPALNFLSWQCTPIYAALLGRRDDARRLITEKLSDKNASLRFTAFFGPGFDWIPDHNWGGTSMIGLQSMLVAPADKGMHLLPAWPEDWTAEFRLHLPEQGILSARVESGQIHDLEVTTPTGKPYPHPIVQPTPS